MTKITLETKYGSCTVEVREDDLTLNEVMRLLIIPVLLGSGYAAESVEDVFDQQV